MPDDLGDENGKIEMQGSVFFFSSGVVALLLLLADGKTGDNSENSREIGLVPNLNGQLKIWILRADKRAIMVEGRF